jgi:hypothetical protein
MKTETCTAEKMLERSEVICVDGHVLSTWRLETLDCDEDEVVFECSYTDHEGLIFEFSFEKRALMDAVVSGNNIVMTDVTNDEVHITCCVLTPVTI